jgi:ubiquinone/menaquinone biosynthesis C-methylase UbiE
MAKSRPATLLELGCGMGLLGTWIAKQLRANLIGIDFSQVAISLARRGTSHLESIQKTFLKAPFESTGLSDRSIDAGFSLDAFYLSKDPARALKELHRVTRTGSPVLFTYFLDSNTQYDWPRLTKSEGFDVLSVTDVTSGWRRHMREKHLRRWASRDQIRMHLKKRAEAELSVTVSMLGLDGCPAYIDSTFRFLLHAVRQ